MSKGRGASAETTSDESTASGADGARTRSRRKSAAPSEAEARRALAESTKIYYRIGEVSKLTGVKAHVLRYWETEFRWMAPPKSRSKQRLYRKRDIEFVWLLKKLLWEKRFTIAGARQRIQELGLEESLARNADGEASESFFSVSDVVQAAIGAEDVPASPQPDPSESTGRSRARNPGDATTGSEWLGIGAALAEMQAELLTLRGVLQQGL